MLHIIMNIAYKRNRDEHSEVTYNMSRRLSTFLHIYRRYARYWVNDR